MAAFGASTKREKFCLVPSKERKTITIKAETWFIHAATDAEVAAQALARLVRESIELGKPSRICAFEELPQLAESYARGETEMFPIFAVNMPAS